MRRLLPLAALGAAVLLAACGSGGSSSEKTATPAASPTRAGTTATAPASPATATAPAGGLPTASTGGTMTLADCKRTGEKQFSRAPDLFIDPNKTYIATVKTVKGDFKIQLFAKEAPDTVNNFVFLACKGYYDGTTFHRVVPGFVAQGGDPTGSGSGGPGYNIKFESSNTPYTAGVVGMASRGAHSDTAGSQFFIALTDITAQLSPANYATFGKVIEGIDVVDKISPRDPTDPNAPPGDKINEVDVTEQ